MLRKREGEGESRFVHACACRQSVYVCVCVCVSSAARDDAIAVSRALSLPRGVARSLTSARCERALLAKRRDLRTLTGNRPVS